MKRVLFALFSLSVVLAIAFSQEACTRIDRLGSTTVGELGAPPYPDGTCDLGLTVCDGLCTDLLRDAEHCAQCNHACVVGTTCRLGACTSTGSSTVTPGTPCAGFLEPCCPTPPICISGLSCNGGVCTSTGSGASTCGALFEPCCATTSSTVPSACLPFLICSGGTCTSTGGGTQTSTCGFSGTPCCTTPPACESGTTCMQGTCL